MRKIPFTMNAAIGPMLVALILVLTFGTLTFAQGYRYKTADAWSFGVMADTQWTLGYPGAEVDPEGTNPFTISDSIGKQIREEFIRHNVRFAFQLGDLSNWAGDEAHAYQGEAAQMLYDAGIGFFPIRGNHEEYGFYFGQDPYFNCNTPAFLEAFPQTRGLENTFGATNFSSPTELIPFDYSYLYLPSSRVYAPNDDLDGLSYSFDYGVSGSNARFVLLDTNALRYEWVDFDADGEVDGNEIVTINYIAGQQQNWISERLDNEARGTTHAFVLAHRGVMGANHSDGIFGSSWTSKSWAQRPFYESLYTNDVRHYLSGHDHLYQRSIVKGYDYDTTPYQVTQIISAAASTKFYMPRWSSTESNNVNKRARETVLSQEFDNVGYYIYTVDGPRVTVDYYSDVFGAIGSDYCYPYGVEGAGDCGDAPDVDEEGNLAGPEEPGTLITPKFNFVRKESYGYSLNGAEYVVAKGGPYTVVQETFNGTTAQILDGMNASTAIAPLDRPLSKAVNTGWTPKPAGDKKILSDIFSLWGMEQLGSDSPDTYVLEMSYVDRREKGRGKKLGNAGYRLSTLDKNGHWVNAVKLNVGQKNAKNQKFIKGPWKPGYKLGTYGIDMANGTVWAVINYDADFAATQ